MKLLILEDDKTTAKFLQNGFKEAGFNSEVYSEGNEALEQATNLDFDLLIVDIMVQGMDGLNVVDQLRKRGRQMPVLFLSAKREIEDRIEGLRLGGDDYLTKPFSFSELLARCQAILRRTSKAGASHVIHVHDIDLDLFRRTVKRGADYIELQQKEFALLEYFMRHPGTVLTKTQILENIWQYNFDPQTNVVDVLVCRLRNKLERGRPEKLIKTIRGVGYVFRD